MVTYFNVCRKISFIDVNCYVRGIPGELLLKLDKIGKNGEWLQPSMKYKVAFYLSDIRICLYVIIDYVIHAVVKFLPSITVANSAVSILSSIHSDKVSFRRLLRLLIPWFTNCILLNNTRPKKTNHNQDLMRSIK